MNSQSASGVRFVAVRRLQRLLDQMALPACHCIMEWHSCGSLSVEYTRGGLFILRQLLFDLLGCDGASASLDGCSLDQMFQFSNIAWEGIALQSHDGIGSQSRCGGLIAPGVTRKEILGQGEYVGLTFAERREPDRKSVEAIKQIGSKGLLFHVVF